MEIEETVQIGLPVRINFSRPGFSPATVKQVGTLGQRHGVGIHVGFYNFDTEHFDPNRLPRISHVQNLHLGLIREGRILEVLRELNLRSLRLNQIFDLSAVRDLLG